MILTMFALIAPSPIGAGGMFVFAFMIAGLCFPARRAVWILVGLTVLPVTNVLKHSGASRCDVRLTREDGSAQLVVEDDGHGADSVEGGSGLAGMRERVERAGGTLTVASRDGGMRVKVTVPHPA